MTKVSDGGFRGSSVSLSPLRLASEPLQGEREPSATSIASPPAIDRGSAIADGLRRYETLLRDAHVEGLKLQIQLRGAQGDSGRSAISGYQLFSRLDEAQLQISTALGHAAIGHTLAYKLAPLVGIDPTAYGEETLPNEFGGGRPSGISHISEIARA